MHPLFLVALALSACAAAPSTAAAPDTGATGAAGPTDTVHTPPVDADADGVPSDRDCDDADPARAPGRAEVCDGRDNDCDPGTDDVRRATFTPRSGPPQDLTTALGAGSPTVPSRFAPEQDGTLALCSGDWSIDVDATAVRALTIAGIDVAGRPRLVHAPLPDLAGLDVPPDATVHLTGLAITAPFGTRRRGDATALPEAIVLEDLVFTGSLRQGRPLGSRLAARRVTARHLTLDRHGLQLDGEVLALADLDATDAYLGLTDVVVGRPQGAIEVRIDGLDVRSSLPGPPVLVFTDRKKGGAVTQADIRIADARIHGPDDLLRMSFEDVDGLDVARSYAVALHDVALTGTGGDGDEGLVEVRGQSGTWTLAWRGGGAVDSPRPALRVALPARSTLGGATASVSLDDLAFARLGAPFHLPCEAVWTARDVRFDAVGDRPPMRDGLCLRR